jgi:hypothetical protein
VGSNEGDILNELSLKRTFRILPIGLLLFAGRVGFAQPPAGIVFNYFSNGSNAVVIDSLGRIVTADSSGLPGFALTRHNSDGSMDKTFGNEGVATSDFSSASTMSAPAPWG